MFNYRKKKRYGSALSQVLVILLVFGVIFPALCAIPGISSIICDLSTELLGNTVLTEHWLSLLSEYAKYTDWSISELLPHWISGVYKLLFSTAIESIVIAVFVQISVFIWHIWDPDGIPVIPTVLGTILGLLVVRFVDFGVGIYILTLILGIGFMVLSTRKRSKLRLAIAKEIPSMFASAIAASLFVGYVCALRFFASSSISKVSAIPIIILASVSFIFFEILLCYLEKRWEKKI